MAGTGVRASVERTAAAAIIGVAALAFTSAVHLLPATPYLPIFLAATLAIVAAYRGPVWPAGVLALIVFATVIYQLTGFTVWEARNPVGVILIVAVAAALLVTLLSAVGEATSMAIAVLAVAAMFTPYYYVSVALITAAAVSGPEKKMWPMVATFILTLGPLLVVENSLAPQGDGGPMIFAQLVNLGANMRPPLTSLNIFLPNPTPADFLDPAAAARVLAYFGGGQIYQLIVPLAVLAAVFSLSAVAAGAVNGVLRRLADAVDRGRLVGRITPLLVSFVAPLAFTTLIVAFSHRDLGGYRTTLDAWDSAGLVAASLTLGAVYTGKEHATALLERTELARTRLRERLDGLLKVTAGNTRLIAHVREQAPSIDLGQEAKANHEAAAAVKDLDAGIDAMNRGALEQWIVDVEALTRRAEGLPESMRLKIAYGVNGLTTYALTISEALSDAGVDQPFTVAEKTTSTIEEAIDGYTRAADETRRGAAALLDAFTEAQEAYHTLTARPGGLLPVDPMALFDSHDEQAGLRLVAEEYVLRFQNTSHAELEAGLAALNEAAARYRKEGGRVSPGATAALLSGRPMDSPAILREIITLRGDIESTVEAVEDENRRFREYIDGLAPGAWELVGIDSPGGRQGVARLQTMNAELPTTIADTAALLDEATTLLRNRAEERRRNEEAVMVAVQYPYAKRIIEARLAEGGEVRLGDLPYASAPAHLYARLYARGDDGARYDADEEALTRV